LAEESKVNNRGLRRGGEGKATKTVNPQLKHIPSFIEGKKTGRYGKRGACFSATDPNPLQPDQHQQLNELRTSWTND
jgi:hypothetical protein